MKLYEEMDEEVISASTKRRMDRQPDGKRYSTYGTTHESHPRSKGRCRHRTVEVRATVEGAAVSGPYGNSQLLKKHLYINAYELIGTLIRWFLSIED